jgi:hypothetical protein
VLHPPVGVDTLHIQQPLRLVDVAALEGGDLAAFRLRVVHLDRDVLGDVAAPDGVVQHLPHGFVDVPPRTLGQPFPPGRNLGNLQHVQAAIIERTGDVLQPERQSRDGVVLRDVLLADRGLWGHRNTRPQSEQRRMERSNDDD